VRRPVIVGAAAVNADGENVPSVTQAQLGKVYLTNPVGQKILELCDGTNTVHDIVEVVVKEFKCNDSGAVEQDVTGFLSLAEEKGIVEWQVD